MTLKEQLIEAKKDRDDYRSRAYQAEDELKKNKEEDRYRLSVKYSDEREASKYFVEIIRWLVNPETAKDPFNQIEGKKVNKF